MPSLFTLAALAAGAALRLWTLHALIDLGTCLLVARLATRVCGPRAGRLALLLAALCPFTANYAAAPLTETLSVFCVALGFLALAEILESPRPLWMILLI